MNRFQKTLAILSVIVLVTIAIVVIVNVTIASSANDNVDMYDDCLTTGISQARCAEIWNR